jgi:WhiB family redox-sensing transcriptional regulator
MGWADHAACRDKDPSWFFFDGGNQQAHSARARAVCVSCPVVDVCREYAIANNIEHGIWGGTSSRDRKRIRAARNRARTVAA